MRKFSFFILLCCSLLHFSNTFGQELSYPMDWTVKDEFYDDERYKELANYIEKYLLDTDDKVERGKLYTLKLSQTKKLIVISYYLKYYTKTEMPNITGDGYRDQFGNWYDTMTKVTEHTNKKVFGVIYDSQNDSQSFIKVHEYFDIKTIPHKKKLLVLRKYKTDIKDYVYKGITCYDYDGAFKWEYDNDFVIFHISLTKNNMYAVGGRNFGEYKVFNLDNGTILDERRSEARNLPSRFTSVKLLSNGVNVVETIKDSPSQTVVFPYISNDKSLQQSLLIGSLNKDKAADQITLGNYYLKGDILEKDLKKAFQWYMKAAEQNDIQGIMKVAECYKNGIGVDKDNQQAVNYLEKAAQKNNKEAMIAVSKMYVDGDGIPKNMNRGLYWKERLAFNDDYDAQKYVIANQSVEHERIIIGPIDARNIAVRNHKEKNYDWAEFCIKRAIELGSSEAPLDYGLWLGKGDGVQKDYGKAEEYLTPFAENGNKDAAAVLSTIYQAINDKKKEMYWLEKAALNGDVNSMFRMAEAYQNGESVKKDKKKSFEMYIKAAELGNQDAIKKAVYSYITGKGVKKDAKQGIDWYKRLNLENQLSVAKEFEDNPKIKVDLAVIIVMYQTVAEKKHYGAMKRYAEYAVEYLSEQKAIDALNSLEGANVDYSTKNADTYMLWGKLHESNGRISQAIECYRNAGTPEGREKASKLNRRR